MAKKKRCGIGKVWDTSISDCRKMTPKEKRYVKESTISHAVSGANIGSKVGGIAKKKYKDDLGSAVVGGVIGAYAGYKSGKKSLRKKDWHSKEMMKGYPEGQTRAFSYKKKDKKKKK